MQFELPKTPPKKVAIEHDTSSLSPTKIKTPPTKVATEHDTGLLSPSTITTAGEHATVTGLLASLSPIKPTRYFDGELTDGQSVIRLVGFDKAKLRQLQPFSDYGVPVTLRNCLVQKNKFKDQLEVVLKTHTTIEESHAQFDVTDLKTVLISLIQLQDIAEHDRVTIRISVIKVYEVQKVGTKTKQDVVVADATAKSTVTLWENGVNSLQQGISYQLNRLEVRVYMGKKHLSFPSSLSKDEISDIDDVIDGYTSSDDDQEQLQCVSVSGIRELQSFHQCIHCNKSVKPSSSNIGTCETCSTMQKLSEPKVSARLVIHAEHQKLILKASDEILKTIAQSQMITPMFNCTYNKFNSITSVSRH